MTKIIVIGTYFGRWPVWFPAFLLSCAKNETIDWLFFTDCEIPQVTYLNIHFEPMNLSQFNDLASRKLGLCIQKGPWSHIDLQSAFGVIFEDYIKGYDFWGHCDVDVVWGDIRSFITEQILQNSDIVSSRKDFLAGYFTLWRNIPEMNTLFRAVSNYREIFQCGEWHSFNESIISLFLWSCIDKGEGGIRVYWPAPLFAWFYGGANPIEWYWISGKVFDTKHREHIGIHFQQWKKWVTLIDFSISDQPARFEFTRLGIRSRRPSLRDVLNEKPKWEGLKGSISQFLGKPRRFLRLLKRVLLVRNIYWAQRLTESSINARVVRYESRTGSLRLKHLDLQIGKQQHFLLEGYHAALQLKNQRGGRFHSDDRDALFVDVAGLRFAIQSPEEILSLKELFVDGKYNMLFSRPVVVLDIGMDVGLASIYFASQPNVVVVGYEPCQEMYNQALCNISLNAALADKIRAVKAGIGDAEIKTIAHHFSKMEQHPAHSVPNADYGMGPEFHYEEIEIKDAADMLDSIVADYPGRDIVLKIDLKHPKYHVDGLEEDHLINRLYSAGKLDLIGTIMLEWHKPKPEYNPPAIARQLSDYGFQVFLFSPYDAYEGMLYAVRGNAR